MGNIKTIEIWCSARPINPKTKRYELDSKRAKFKINTLKKHGPQIRDHLFSIFNMNEYNKDELQIRYNVVDPETGQSSKSVVTNKYNFNSTHGPFIIDHIISFSVKYFFGNNKEDMINNKNYHVYKYKEFSHMILRRVIIDSLDLNEPTLYRNPLKCYVIPNNDWNQMIINGYIRRIYNNENISYNDIVYIIMIHYVERKTIDFQTGPDLSLCKHDIYDDDVLVLHNFL
eukprot:279721_1